MSIYKRAEVMLREQFNLKNGLNLLPQHVKFRNPRPASAEDVTMGKFYNSVIDMELQRGAPLNGVAPLFYNRIVLNQEFANSRLVDINYIKVDAEKTTRDLIPRLNLKLGLHLLPEDVVDEPLNIVGLYSMQRIKTNDISSEFMGYFDIGLIRTTAPTVNLDVMLDATHQLDQERRRVNARTEAPVYPLNYHLDYSAVSAVFRQIVVTENFSGFRRSLESSCVMDQSGRLIDALNSVDGLGWASSGVTAALNLTYAVCLYNGPTKDCLIDSYGYYNASGYTGYSGFINEFGLAPIPDGARVSNPADTSFNNVCVLALHDVWNSTNRFKTLVLFHYNGD